MWKIQKLDEQLFNGFAARVHEFLDIEPLMPPGRLRFSNGQADYGWAFVQMHH